MQPSAAQQAAFINGSFVAAFYSKHNNQVKFVNTYTNQVFSWYSYSGETPRLWFAGVELVIANNETVTVASFQKNQKTVYSLRGKPIAGTLLELIETTDSILIKHIVYKKLYAAIAKQPGEKTEAVAAAGNEKKLAIAVSNDGKQKLQMYSIDVPAALLWEKEIKPVVQNSLLVANNGDIVAMYDGAVSSVLNGADGAPLYTVADAFRCLRFTATNELICVNTELQKAALFAKTKNNQLKTINTLSLKDGLYTGAEGKEVTIEWNMNYVSDDLTMAIGFGANVAGLYKNGPVFLFF